MGCDIHLHQEVKIKGQWHHYGCPRIDRSYHLFGVLSDVRCNASEFGFNKCLATKGIPQDATFLTKFDYEQWGGEAHTPGQIGRDGMCLVDQFMKDQKYEILRFWETFGSLFGNDWFDKESAKSADVEDARWIFWYDN